MNTPVILIIDDEQSIREMIHATLSLAGFKCLQAENTLEAIEQIYNHQPNLLLLDWMLPDTDGLTFAKRLRREESTKTLPIIMLTARAEEQLKVQALQAAVDDYIIKPFSRQELIARIQAVLRRSNSSVTPEIITADKLKIDQLSHRVFCDDEIVNLGPIEYRLLALLMTQQERAFSRTQLLDQVWGNNVYIEDRTVDVHIRRLRKALEPFGQDHLVQTVRGTGYRFSTRG